MEVLYMQYESERIEYKSQMIDDIYKEVIAFANTDGGVIYLGIDDKGNQIGIDNVDETYTRLTNGIRDAIAPDVTMFVRYVLQDNKVIRIEVGEGSYKPYYLKSKGMKPTGVYVRQGTSSVQASPEQIRQMIKESDGDTYEDSRSLEQELTFGAAKTAFQRYGVEFSVEKYRALGITQNDVYTNLALLLSDQCHHTIKVAVFKDEFCTEFRDSKEFGGSVFKQFEDVLDRDFSTTAPMQKWTTDVSQFGFSWGKCYLSPILDMNTNEIISYDLSQSANMEQIQRMLAGAFTKFPSVDGLIFHSDQGWQYQHVYFRQALKDHKIIQSMSRKGNCYDNCIMETFFGRMKNEMFYGHEKEYSAFETFAKAVDGYINYYNNERIQEKTKWMPPTKFREASMCT